MSQYQILTPSGWSNLHGVKKKKSIVFKIKTETGKWLKCTPDHKLFVEDEGFVELQWIEPGVRINTITGYETVISKMPLEGLHDVYDALEVQKKNEYYTNGMVSHNCEFLGSSNTLIDGATLKALTWDTPLVDKNGIKIYQKPEKNKVYVCVVDVSRGKGLDYNALQIVDVTQMPYQQVATFRDNMTSPADYVEIVHYMAKLYNNAYTLVEINDIGEQVSHTLHFEYEMENLLFTENAGRLGKRISGGYGKNVDKGIRTTKSVKSVGCSVVKMLLEQEQLILHDFDTVKEFSTFSRKGTSYEAESGEHDDLVMCMVLFSWLTDQTFFKDITDINTMMKLKEKTEREIEEQMIPFGFHQDDIGDELVDSSSYVSYNF